MPTLSRPTLTQFLENKGPPHLVGDDAPRWVGVDAPDENTFVIEAVWSRTTRS